MAYHTKGKKTKTKKTKQKKGQKKSNVKSVIQNIGGRFKSQPLAKTAKETREEQTKQDQQQQAPQTKADTSQQLQDIRGMSAASMYQPPQPVKSTVEEVVEESNVEPKPTLPPFGMTPMDPKLNTLSPLGQWIWTGSGWVLNVEPKEDPQLPAPASPPDDPRIEFTTRLYPGINVRSFYGFESYRDILEDFVKDNQIELSEWHDYLPSSPSDYQSEVPVALQTREYLINTILKDVPILKISKLEADGTTGRYFQPGVPMGTMPVVDLPTNSSQRLDEIQSVLPDGARGLYVIEVGTSTSTNVQNHYDVTYLGLEDELDVRYYETEPYEQVPISLPAAYQFRYENEWAPEFEDVDVPNNQFCATCKFYEPEGGYCTKWNAEVRLPYWCASWKQLEYVEAPSNEFTQFLRTRGFSNQTGPNDYIYNYFQERVKFPASGDLYPSDLHGEPNLDNFLTSFSVLFQDYGAILVGDYLRQAVYSGNAFDVGENVELDFIFQTPGLLLAAMNRIQKQNLTTTYRIPPETYDLRVQGKVTYTLTSTSNTPQYYPGVIKINLLGNWFGEVKNILSQMLITNTKYAYTPYFNNTNYRCVWKDDRITPFEVAGHINIDIIKQNIMNRFLVYANDPTNATTLNSDSALKFMSWVARRAPYTENMQALYQVLLNTENFSVQNQQFISAIENAIGDQLPDDPTPVDMPLVTNLLDTPLPDYLLNGETNNSNDEEVTQQEISDVGGGY